MTSVVHVVYQPVEHQVGRGGLLAGLVCSGVRLGRAGVGQALKLVLNRWTQEVRGFLEVVGQHFAHWGLGFGWHLVARHAFEKFTQQLARTIASVLSGMSSLLDSLAARTSAVCLRCGLGKHGKRNALVKGTLGLLDGDGLRGTEARSVFRHVSASIMVAAVKCSR